MLWDGSQANGSMMETVSCGTLGVLTSRLQNIVRCGDYDLSCKTNILKSVKHHKHQMKSLVGYDGSINFRKEVRTPCQIVPKVSAEAAGSCSHLHGILL